MTSKVLRVALFLALCLALYVEAESVFDAAQKEQLAEAAKERNLQRNIADDHVRVSYCTACGFQQNFNQIKTYLEDTSPHLVDRIVGSNYEVDPYKTMLAHFLGYAHATALILLVFGEYVSALKGT